MKIGILGGSFNPPHLGHLFVALWAYAGYDLDRIIVVPCFKHPFGKTLLDFKHRFNMCRICFSKFKDFIEISDIERREGKVSRTYNTLRLLSKKYKRDKLFLIVGSDIVKEKDQWFRIKELENKYPFIVIPRGGKASKGLFIPDIKSRNIRRIIRQKRSTQSFLVRGVSNYIRSRRLYSA